MLPQLSACRIFPSWAPCLAPPAGPYTSFDLNTLLKNTAGSRQDITLSLKDDLAGETSRIAGKQASQRARSQAGGRGQAAARGGGVSAIVRA